MSDTQIEEGLLSVSTENLLPIIKKWLYSEHDIFLRELISNAHDAILKLQRLKLEGIFTEEEPTYKIVLIPDKENKTLTIQDNGLGLDSEDVKKYINQIAFSGAQEFVKTYEQVKDKENLIGHFGLGFYSAFMVSSKVEIFSLSFKEKATAIHWKSDGSTRYTLKEGQKKEIGTQIILHLLDDSLAYLEPQKIKGLVKKYSNFLPIDIYLKEKDKEEEKINAGSPLWAKNPQELKDQDYLNFYKELFPGELDPLFWISIRTETPFELRGVLFFPKLTHDLDISKGNIKLFSNNVFVADKLKEVTPEFLSILMGALDSQDIPLNVSRSQLQGDPRITKISSHIVRKVAEKITALFNTDKEKYQEIWEQIGTFIKYGCLADTHFYNHVKKAILFKDLNQKWTSLEEYLEANKDKNKDKEGKTLILYLDSQKDNSSFEPLLKEQEINALILDSTIDSHFIGFLEQQNQEIRFARADSDLNQVFFDNLTPVDSKKAEEISALFKRYLDDETLQVEVKNFKSKNLPAMLINQEQMRRLQEMTAMMMGGKKNTGFSLDSLIINAQSDVVQKLLLLDTTDAKRTKEMVIQIHDLAALASGKLQANKLFSFIKRNFEALK